MVPAIYRGAKRLRTALTAPSGIDDGGWFPRVRIPNAISTRLKYRGNGSKTKLKYRKRKRSKTVRYGNDDKTTEKFRLVLNKRPVAKRTKQKLRYEEVWQNVSSANEGSQFIVEARYHHHIDAFCNATTVRNSTTGQGFILGDMLPNQKITGNNNASIAGLAAGSTSVFPSYNLERATCTMDIVNMENAGATVWVYFLLCTRNSESTPSALWDAQLNSEAIGTSTDVPTLTTDATWSIGQVTKTFLNQSPMSNSQVRRFFKVMKVCKFDLDGGETHTLQYDLIINKRIDMYYLNLLNSQGVKFVQGLSIVPLVIAKGSLVGINDTGASTTASEVTTAPTKLGMMCTRKFILSERSEPPPKPATLACYGTVSSGSAHVYGPSLINDEDANAGIIKV